jgi:hypothetical protein
MLMEREYCYTVIYAEGHWYEMEDGVDMLLDSTNELTDI